MLLTHLSLFSGIGGIDLAAHWEGFQTVQFVERDPYCYKVLSKNFPGVPIHDNILTFDAKPFKGTLALVSAGFPCQPHSLAGQRKGSDDERDLWQEVVRVLREAEPRWFLGENVAGLLSSDGGWYFGTIIGDLARLGYRVGWCKFGSCDVGAPHKRERVFIVAYAPSKRRAEASQPWARCDSEGSTKAQREGANLWNEIARICDSQDWEALACMVSRSDDGVPGWMDRRRALGNAVNPYQVQPILAEIANECLNGNHWQG